MTDHDVGKIWASVLAGGMKSPEDIEVVKGLIRKLVGVQWAAWAEHFSGTSEQQLGAVLKKFNIDPATWTKE